MHVNNTYRKASVWHLPFGGAYSCITFDRHQLRCPVCGKTRMQEIQFKADGHMITKGLHQYTVELLRGIYTQKQVTELTGLSKNTVRAIEEKRLRDKYTIDGTKLIQPERQAKHLGIDEFKLHDGCRYATHIIDMETGHILRISHGKRKQVVYDFIDHVGMAWMEGVEAVACDMTLTSRRPLRSAVNGSSRSSTTSTSSGISTIRWLAVSARMSSCGSVRKGA